MSHLPLFPPGTKTYLSSLSSGIEMRCYERGEGVLAVFLHGFPELAVSWRHQLAGLGEHARCVAVDLRGYGGTTSPAEVAAYYPATLTRDIVALCDALGAERVHLVGHDWGGAIAWDMARHFPERLLSLSVLNCPPREVLMQALWRRPPQLWRSLYILFFQLPWLPERFFRGSSPGAMRRLFERGTVRPEAFDDAVIAAYAEQAQRTGMHGGLNYYRAAPRALERGTPPKIELPVRLIWGLEDRALGPWFADAALYRDLATHFDVVRLPEAGHCVQQEAPDAVNAALLEHWRAAPGGLQQRR